MKKIFFLLLAILPLAALAQNENRRVSIEPHAGMTISKMHGGALTRDETWKTGWTAGAELEIPLSTYYSLTTGVDYALIGTGFKEEKEQYSSAKSWITSTLLITSSPFSLYITVSSTVFYSVYIICILQIYFVIARSSSRSTLHAVAVETPLASSIGASSFTSAPTTLV